MFQFTPLASSSLWIQERMTRHDPRRVSPFGHRRITAYVQLPDAYRSLSRPSSPVRAKASTVRPSTLDRICLVSGPPLPHLQRGALLSAILAASLSLDPGFQSLKSWDVRGNWTLDL